MAEDNHEIVEVIVPPHPLRARRIGMGDGPVVRRIPRRIAPAILRRQGGAGKRGAGRRPTVRPEQQAADRPDAERARAVTFPFGVRRDHATPAQRATDFPPRQIETAVGKRGEDHAFRLAKPYLGYTVSEA